MYPTLSDGIVLANSLKKTLEDIQHLEIVVCPPAIMLPIVHDILGQHKINNLHIGAQNIHSEEMGAFTGEVSAGMVKAFADYVIVGHSERVKWFHESSHETNKKVHLALKHNLTPIIAVGEPKKTDSSIDFVVTKLNQLIEGVSKSDLDKIVVAYEPIWAISNGKTNSDDSATGEHAQNVASAIRKIVSSDTRIIYGGSTDSINISEFLDQPDVNGALVGASSVKAKEFITMCQLASGL